MDEFADICDHKISKPPRPPRNKSRGGQVNSRHLGPVSSEHEVHAVEMTENVALATLKKQIKDSSDMLATICMARTAYASQEPSSQWYEHFSDFKVDYILSSEIMTLDEAALTGYVSVGGDSISTIIPPYYWACTDISDVNIEGVKLDSTLHLPLYVVDFVWQGDWSLPRSDYTPVEQLPKKHS